MPVVAGFVVSEATKYLRSVRVIFGTKSLGIQYASNRIGLLYILYILHASYPRAVIVSRSFRVSFWC